MRGISRLESCLERNASFKIFRTRGKIAFRRSREARSINRRALIDRRTIARATYDRLTRDLFRIDGSAYIRTGRLQPVFAGIVTQKLVDWNLGGRRAGRDYLKPVRGSGFL